MDDWKRVIGDSRLTETSKDILYKNLLGDEGGRNPELDNSDVKITRKDLRDIKEQGNYDELLNINNREYLEDGRRIKLDPEKHS